VGLAKIKKKQSEGSKIEGKESGGAGAPNGQVRILDEKGRVEVGGFEMHQKFGKKEKTKKGKIGGRILYAASLKWGREERNSGRFAFPPVPREKMGNTTQGVLSVKRRGHRY